MKEFKIRDIDLKAENETIMQAISKATRAALECGGHGCHDCDVDDTKPDHPSCITCRHYPRTCNWVPQDVPALVPKKEAQ